MKFFASVRSLRVDPLVLTVAVACVLLARYLRHALFDDVGHIQDELTYLVQAKSYAHGRLAEPALPQGAFTMWFVEDRAERFGIFPPGWPALLAVGLRVHVENWLNPVLHGITTVTIATAVSRTAGSTAGRVAGVLHGATPQALLLASSWMSHGVPTLTGAALLLFVATHWKAKPAAAVSRDAAPSKFAGGREPTGPSLAQALANGRASLFPTALFAFGLAITVLARPLCAIVLSVTFLATVVFLRRNNRRVRREVVVVVGVAFIAMIAFFLWNKRLTGAYFLTAQSLYFDTHLPPVDSPLFRYARGCNDLGFGPTHGCEYTIGNAHHTLGQGLLNTGDNLRGWGLLGGPLLLVPAVLGLRTLRRDPVAPTALLLIVLTVGAYFTYWYPGTALGARFYHAAFPALVYLAAPVVAGMPERLHRGHAALHVGYAAFVLLHVSDEVSGMFWGTDSRFAAWRAGRSKPALVFVAFDTRSATFTGPQAKLFWTTQLTRKGFWAPNLLAASAIATNEPDGPVVFAKYHPALVSLVQSRFPDREPLLWIATPDGVQDRVVPLAEAPEDPRPVDLPVPNFDGYLIGPSQLGDGPPVPSWKGTP